MSGWKSKLPALAAVGLPLLAMGGWVGSLEYDIKTSPQIQLPITGYDPRDLLSGHYLTYTVTYGRDVCPRGGPSEHDEVERCVCFGTTSDKSKTQASWIGECGDRPSGEFCRAHLKGTCQYGRFNAGIEAFYFSEHRTTELAVVPPNSSILLRVSSSGRGIVTGLLIDGKPYQQFFEEQAFKDDSKKP